MLAKFLRNKVAERRAVRGLAAASRLQGQYQSAIKHLQRVLEISREMGDHVGDADAYGTIADIYTDMGDLEAVRSSAAGMKDAWAKKFCQVHIGLLMLAEGFRGWRCCCSGAVVSAIGHPLAVNCCISCLEHQSSVAELFPGDMCVLLQACIRSGSGKREGGGLLLSSGPVYAQCTLLPCRPPRTTTSTSMPWPRTAPSEGDLAAM